MQLWIAVHLAQATLDSHSPRWRTEAVVVLDNGQVCACSPMAAQAGVRPGMRASGANAMCPAAVLRPYDAQARARLLEAAALALLQYTPEVALGEEDTILMDVAASLRLFGGIRALCRRITATAQGLGIGVRLAVAPTASGAGLLAVGAARRRRVLKLSSLARRLDTMPCASLPAASRHLEWLAGIGCDTLAALRRLPRAALQRRTHSAVLQALDHAYGQAPDLRSWFAAPASFSGRVELDERIEHAVGVLFVAGHLVEQLCGWLVAHHRAATRLELRLDHERGRHACPPTVLDIRLAGPSWAATRIMPLITERLHRTTLVAPAIAVGLHALDIEPLAPAPVDLFPQPGASPADHAHVMALLIARLGRDNVLQPSPVADHRPEVANGWRPADEVSETADYVPSATRPSWVLDEPIALMTRDHRPYYCEPLHIVQGPERIEDGWWDRLVVRDYFVAESPQGVRYWIYRERGAAGWFLHGLFG